MQTLNAYRQGIQDGEMWPGDGSHNVVSEGKSEKRKKVKYCLSTALAAEGVRKPGKSLLLDPAYSRLSNIVVGVRTR